MLTDILLLCLLAISLTQFGFELRGFVARRHHDHLLPPAPDRARR